MGIFDREPAHAEPHAELKKLNEDVHNALTALREASDQKNVETVDRVEKFFEKYEEENSKFVRLVIEMKKQAIEMDEALSTGGVLNTKGRLGFSAYGRENSIEYKTFAHWISRGTARQFGDGSWDASSLDFKTLRTDSESAGGYLIPQVMDNQIRKNIIEISPVRAHARVRRSPGKTMEVPRRLSVPIAQFEGEAEMGPEDQPIFGNEQVTCYRQTVTIPLTFDLLMSSAFDLEQELAQDVGESFAQGEGLNFVKGNGRKSPQGFIADGRCVSFTSGTSGNFDFTDLSNMSGKIKSGQNPWWYMNRRTVAYIQSLTSSIGVPIWQPVAGNQPATIWGWPYDSRMIDLDDVSTGSGAKPVVFADLYRGYEIFDMDGMNVVKDELSKAKQAIVEYTFRRYNTGRVILPEAICVMTLL